MLNWLVILGSMLLLLPTAAFSQDAETHLRQAAVYDSLVQSFMGEDQFGFSTTHLPASSQDSVKFYANKAIEAYTAALTINPSLLEVRYNRAWMWRNLDICAYMENEIADYDAILRLYERQRNYIDEAHFRESDYEALIQACLEFGNPIPALNACNRGLTIFPNYTFLREKRIYLNILLNRYTAVMADFDTLMRANELLLNTWFDENGENTNFNEENWIDTNAQKNEFYLNRAFAKAMLGDTVGALQDFLIARANMPNFAQFFRYSQEAFVWRAHSKATNRYHYLLIVLPRNLRGAYNYSFLLKPSLAPEQIAKLTHLISLGYATSEAHLILSIAHAVAGYPPEALRRDLLSALALASDAPQRIFIRAMLHGYFPQ